jgi:hypothetical protein
MAVFQTNAFQTDAFQQNSVAAPINLAVTPEETVTASDGLACAIKSTNTLAAESTAASEALVPGAKFSNPLTVAEIVSPSDTELAGVKANSVWNAVSGPVLDATACPTGLVSAPVYNSAGVAVLSGVSSSFSTSGPGLVVVLISSDGFSYPNVSSVVPSGGSFSTAFTQLVGLSNQTNSAIWYAVSSVALSSITLTVTQSVSQDLAFWVVPFSASGGIGAATPGIYGDPSVTITPQQTNSLILATGADDNNFPHTPLLGNTTTIADLANGFGGSNWFLRLTGLTTDTTPDTIGWTGSGGPQTMAAVEILGVPDNVVTPTVTDATGAKTANSLSGATVPVQFDALLLSYKPNAAAGTTVWPTSTFSASANRTLVCLIGMDGAPSIVSETITWTGGTPSGATAWVKRVESVNGNGSDQTVAIWTADVSSALTGVSVTLTFGVAPTTYNDIGIYVQSYSGVTGYAAPTTFFNSASGAQSFPISVTAAGSQVAWLAGNMIGGASLVTPATNCVIDDAGALVAGDTAGVGHLSSTTSGAGSITVGATEVQTSRLGAALELLGGGGGDVTPLDSYDATKISPSGGTISEVVTPSASDLNTSVLVIVNTPESVSTSATDSSAGILVVSTTPESTAASDSVDATVTPGSSHVKNDSFSESVTPSESLVTSAVTTNSVSEPQASSDQLAPGIIISQSVPEFTTPSDSYLSASTKVVTGTPESAAASDTYSSTANLKLTNSAESATTSDSYSVIGNPASYFSESLTASDGGAGSGSITYVGAGAASVAASFSSPTGPVALPAGIVAGDILLMITADPSAAAVSGWTVKSNGTPYGLTVYWRRATGSDTAPTIPAVSENVAFIVAYRGCVSSGDPFEAFSHNESPNGNVTTASVTTLSSNAMLVSVGFGFDDASNFQANAIAFIVSGPISSYDVNSVQSVNGINGPQFAISEGHTVQAVAGASGSQSWTSDGALNFYSSAAFLGALTPAGGVGYSTTSRVTAAVIEGPITGDAQISASKLVILNATESVAGSDTVDATLISGAAHVKSDSFQEFLTISSESFNTLLISANSFNESEAAQDQLSAGDSYTLTLSESQASSDQLVAAEAAARSISESATPQDTLASTSVDSVSNTTESITASDSAGSVGVIGGSTSESHAPSDAYTVQAIDTVTTSADSSTASDTTSSQVNVSGGVLESLGSSDTLSQTFVTTGSFNESVTTSAADSNASVLVVVNSAESTTPSDTVDSTVTHATGHNTFNDSLQESVTLQDLLSTTAIDAVTSAAESVTGSDTALTGQVTTNGASESQAASDALLAGIKFSASLNESQASSDTVDATVTPGSAHSKFDSFSESLTISSENLNNIAVLANSFNESVLTQDGHDGSVKSNNPLSEAQASSDTLSAGNSYSTSVSESQASSDSLFALVSSANSVSESTTPSDSALTVQVSANSVNENLTPSDQLTGNAKLVSSQSESEAASDTVEGARLVTLTLSESEAASDASIANTSGTGSISESTSQLDNFVSTQTLTGTASESILALDTPDSNVKASGSVNEPVSTSDTQAGAVTLGKTLSESVTTSEAESAQKLLGATLNESTSGFESYSNIASLASSVAESPLASDTEAAGSTQRASLIETLTAWDLQNYTSSTSAATSGMRFAGVRKQIILSTPYKPTSITKVVTLTSTRKPLKKK